MKGMAGHLNNDAVGQEPNIQCLPLYSILLALGNPVVDLLSLDINGAELQVLRTIPWEKVNIKVPIKVLYTVKLIVASEKFIKFRIILIILLIEFCEFLKTLFRFFFSGRPIRVCCFLNLEMKFVNTSTNLATPCTCVTVKMKFS